jgi:hypothetical protein
MKAKIKNICSIKLKSAILYQNQQTLFLFLDGIDRLRYSPVQFLHVPTPVDLHIDFTFHQPCLTGAAYATLAGEWKIGALV